jgi:hypothetical protein
MLRQVYKGVGKPAIFNQKAAVNHDCQMMDFQLTKRQQNYFNHSGLQHSVYKRLKRCRAQSNFRCTVLLSIVTSRELTLVELTACHYKF